VTLSVASGTLTATSVTAGGTSRDVSLATTTSGNVVLGSVTAVGDTVGVTSVGNITGAGPVTATSIALDAASNIGTAPAGRVGTVATNLAARSAGGGVWVGNTGSLTLAQVNGINNGSATNGNFDVTTTGTLDVNQTIAANGTGDTRLASTGGTGVILNAAVGTGTNTITRIDSAGTITRSGNFTVTGTGVALNAGTGIGSSGAANVILTAAGTLAATTAAGSLYLSELDGVTLNTVDTIGNSAVTRYELVAGGALNVAGNVGGGATNVRLVSGSGTNITGAGTVIGNNVLLDSDTGVGTNAGSRFKTTAGTLAARSRTSGGVFVNETDAVSLNAVDSVSNATTANADYDILAGGQITVGQNISANGTGDNILNGSNIQLDANFGQKIASANTTLTSNGFVRGTGVLSGDTVSLTTTNGIGTASPLAAVGISANNLSISNTGSGDVVVNIPTGSVNLSGTFSNAAAGGGIGLTTTNGSITHSTQLSSAGVLALQANGTGSTITVDTTGMQSTGGNITLSAANGITVNDGNGVKATSGNVTMVAGAVPTLSTQFSGLPSGLEPTGGGVNAPILINGPIWSGSGTGYSGYTTNLFSTGNIVQSKVNDAGIQALNNSPTNGGLRVVSFNNTSGGGVGTWLDLQNNKATGTDNCSNGVGSGNCVGPLFLEARMAAGGTSPYSAGNISYSSINGTTIFGVGTAADIVFQNPSITLAGGVIKGTNVYFYAYGSSTTTQDGTGSITLEVPITNADINQGNAGGSLNLIADGNINISGSSATAATETALINAERTLIGSRSTNGQGTVTVTKFKHDFKLVASKDINLTGSIYLQGTLDLRAGASAAETATLAHLNSPAVGAGTLPGSVSISAPAGRTFPVEVIADTIRIGASNAPVTDVTIDASLASSTATGTGNVIKDLGISMASAGAMDIYYKGAMQIKAGSASATTADAGSNLFASANAKVAADTVNIVGSGGLTNTLDIKAGTATSNTSAGGSGSAVADVTLFGKTSVKISTGGSVLLRSGTSSTTGSASAAATIDPVVPLTISTGGNLIVQAGVGPGSAALILNQGDIVLTVGGGGTSYSYTYTAASGGATTNVSGLVLIGGAGSGLYGANKLAITLGDEIKLIGGPYTRLIDGGLAKASIEANSPRSLFVDGDLLNYLVYATNESTASARLRVGRSIADDSDLPSCN